MKDNLSKMQRMEAALMSDLSDEETEALTARLNKLNDKFREYSLEKGYGIVDLVDFYKAAYTRNFMALIFTLGLDRLEFDKLKLEMLTSMSNDMDNIFHTFLLSEFDDATKN